MQVKNRHIFGVSVWPHQLVCLHHPPSIEEVLKKPYLISFFSSSIFLKHFNGTSNALYCIWEGDYGVACFLKEVFLQQYVDGKSTFSFWLVICLILKQFSMDTEYVFTFNTTAAVKMTLIRFSLSSLLLLIPQTNNPVYSYK